MTVRRRVDNEVHLLAGVSVLEIGDGVAGGCAGSILASLGASVTSIVDDGAIHRRGRPRLRGPEPGPTTALLAVTLDAAKRTMRWSAEENRSLAGLSAVVRRWYDSRDRTGGSLVICDRVTRPPLGIAELGTATEYEHWVRDLNCGAWVTISAFGLSGRRRDDIASELTLAAAAGLLDSVHDDTGTPLKLPGAQAMLSAGQVAALAACHALDGLVDVETTHMDLSAQEAVIATGPVNALTVELLDASEPAAGGSAGGGSAGLSGLFETSDGFVRILALEEHQRTGIVRALGSSDAPGAPGADALAAPNQNVVHQLRTWMRSLTMSEAESRLQAEGVPAAALSGPTEILASAQLAHRHAIETIAAPCGAELRVIGTPFTTIPSPGHSARHRRLQQLRVLEMGHVLAVPLAGALLGAMGADVTKLEDLNRLDMFRRQGPYIDGEPGPDRGAYFASANFSKRSRAIDLRADPAALERLLASTDVVIENLGRKQADALGLSASHLAASGRDLLACSSSGYGHEGPQSRFRAYAFNIHTSGGLAHLTRDRDGHRADVVMAWADQITAYAIATIVAAWAAGPHGNTPMGVDFSMIEQVACRFNEFLAAASYGLDIECEVDRGNDISPLAPNGVYRAADGWVAVTVGSDGEFRALRDCLGDPAALADDRFADGASRFEARVALDAVVAVEVAAASGETLCRQLRGRGVLAEQVIAPTNLAADEHLRERGFLTPVDHPTWGRRPLIGIAWRPHGDGAIALSAPPVLVGGTS